MFCPHCGSEIEASHVFCRACGRRLHEDPSAVGRPGAAWSGVGTGGAASARAAVRPGGRTLATPAGTYKLAGFAARVGGFLIDSLIFAAAGLLLFAVLASAAGADFSSEQALNASLDNRFYLAFYATAYAIVVGARWAFNASGGSPGQRALGLRIVRESDGRAPGVRLGLGRALGSLVSGLPLSFGYLWAAWDANRQTWHDKMAGTYVVWVERGRR